MSGTYIGLPLSGASPWWGNSVGDASALPVVGQVTGEVVFVLDTLSLYGWDGATWQQLVDGLADVSGPASSTDNAVARFNGTTGKVIQNSLATVDDAGKVNAVDLNASSLTASRALASDGSKNVVASATTATELGYVNGVTSAIQTQINGKEPSFSILPVSKGGTASGTALSNNRLMQSSGSAIVEAAAITASRALASDANGIPVASATTAAELAFVNGVTSAIQTQINTKVTGPASAVDNTIARYDATTGKLIQSSGVTIDDSNNVESIARVNAATGKIGGTGAAATSAVLELAGTTGAFLPTRLTTTQRDTLTASNGMFIYNATVDRFQGYVAGSWLDLQGWGN